MKPPALRHAAACYDLEDGKLDCVCGLTDHLEAEADRYPDEPEPDYAEPDYFAEEAP